MRRLAGSCRFVFNKALALQKEGYAQGEKKLGYAGLCKLLTAWRNSPDTAWLADAPVHPLQQTLKDLERAYSNFFARRPDFARRSRSTKMRRHTTNSCLASRIASTNCRCSGAPARLCSRAGRAASTRALPGSICAARLVLLVLGGH